MELKWSKEVKHYCKNVPIILVANKIDIRTDQDILKQLELENIVRTNYETKSTYVPRRVRVITESTHIFF